jgi:hypothetical protein
MRGFRFAAVGAALGLTCAATPARAVDWEVTGDVIGQGYEIVSPWGDVVLGRRRLISTLGLAAYNLQGGDYQPFKANYSVQLRMRVDADFGVKSGEASYDPADASRFAPGVTYAPVDLMYAYVQGRNLANGVLDFKLGRQYTQNVFGWWSFDGGLVHVTTPFFLALEAYGGLEQRGGLPLSTSRFESQGVWRGAHPGALKDDAFRYPSFQPASVAPAFGLAVESTGPNWIHGRFDFRRVYNLGETFTGQFPFPSTAGPGSGGFEKVSGLRISSDRLGYAASAFLADVGTLRGGFVYDLYYGRVSRAYGALDFHAGKRATIGLDGEYFWPVFDADSIFNWFTHNPSASALARVAAKPSDRLQLSLQAGTKLWLTEGDPGSWATAQCTAGGYATPAQLDACLRYGVDSTFWASSPNKVYDFARSEDNRKSKISPDLLANVGVNYAWLSGGADLRGMVQTGFGSDASGNNRGRRSGATISAKQAIVPGVFWLGGRVSTYEWHDPTRPERDATSFGYVIAPEVQPVQFGKLRVEWEHEMNRLVGQRFRILGLISIRVAP